MGVCCTKIALQGLKCKNKENKDLGILQKLGDFLKFARIIPKGHKNPLSCCRCSGLTTLFIISPHCLLTHIRSKKTTLQAKDLLCGQTTWLHSTSPLPLDTHKGWQILKPNTYSKVKCNGFTTFFKTTLLILTWVKDNSWS